MTVLELSQHPHVDLADLVPQIEAGETVEIWRDGRSLGRLALEPLQRPRLTADLFAARRAMKSPVYPGNSVVDFRKEERF